MATCLDDAADAALDRFVFTDRAPGGHPSGWTRAAFEVHWRWSLRQLRDVMEACSPLADARTRARRATLFWSEAMLQRLADRYPVDDSGPELARFATYRTLYCLGFGHVRAELDALVQGDPAPDRDPRIFRQLRIPLRHYDPAGPSDVGLDRLLAEALRLGGTDRSAVAALARRFMEQAESGQQVSPGRAAEALSALVGELVAELGERYVPALWVVAYAPTVGLETAAPRLLDCAGGGVEVGAMPLWILERWELGPHPSPLAVPRCRTVP